MSDYLFARPSFLEGFARNADFFGALNGYNTSRSPKDADRRAQLEDVKALKNDMQIACDQVLVHDGNRR